MFKRLINIFLCFNISRMTGNANLVHNSNYCFYR
nr:MAG TPA: hypothetical protein [Bacteriophage sp.]